MSPDEVAELVRDLYPIESVTEYGSVMVVTRGNERPHSLTHIRGKKGELTRLNKKSRDYLAFVVNATGVQFNSMMVLTYGANYPRCGKQVKSDLNVMLNWVRRVLKSEYLWFLEFQRRGAPHVHILLETDRVTSGLRYDFAVQWANTVCKRGAYPYCDRGDKSRRSVYSDIIRVHDHRKQWASKRSGHGLVGYVTKYATKTEQKDVPPEFSNVGRFFGWSSEVRKTIQPGYTALISDGELRWSLREIGHRVSDYHVIPKYIFGATLK
jgi:hypothetical protein